MGYDLVIRGGRVIDPSTGLDKAADVALKDGCVAAVGADLADDAAETFDARGCIVTPGLIDLHSHVFIGASRYSINADDYMRQTGTTTWLDAGTSGAANFGGFRKFIIDKAQSRILAYLNISAQGLPLEVGAHVDTRTLDVDDACRVIEENRDVLKGIKVLCSFPQVGEHDLIALRAAREVAEGAGVPIMCHIGKAPPGLWAILPFMRKGDIITHAFKGNRGCLMIAGNKVRPEAREARERGVLFDVGHGSGSWSWSVARAAMEQGFPPDTISTDLHAHSVNGPAFSMPSVMSKYLHLGMSLMEVVRLSTARPAEILGMAGEIGTLATGACGDVAVLRLEEGNFSLADTDKKD